MCLDTAARALTLLLILRPERQGSLKQGLTRLYATHFHISRNAPYLPPKMLHNLCVSFPLGITAVPGEIENNAYAKL